jgi:hypothetical protein
MSSQGRRGSPRARGALLVGALALLLPSTAQAAISVGNVALTEGNSGTAVTFTLTRDAGFLAGPTSVSFATADGSARAPSDYTASSGTRDFPGVGLLFPETQVQHVAVPVAGDRRDEPDESFRLVVTGAEVADGDATATITDDDPPPSVGVADAPPATEGGSAAFTVTLSAASGRDITVAYATANGTATAGQDYTARSGTLAIPAGSTSAAVPVALTDDSADEPAEGFELRLSAPTSATLGDAAATATIVDDDEPPAPAPGPAGSVPPPPPALVLPTLPSTGSAAPPGVPRLGVSVPRLRQPSTGIVTVACPVDAGSCTGQVTLFTRPNKRSKIKELRVERRLGRRTFTLVAGRTQTLTFALSRSDRRLLDRSGRINVRAYALTKDGAGRQGVRTANGTLIGRTAHSSPTRSRSAASGEGLDEVGRALGAVVGRSPVL